MNKQAPGHKKSRFNSDDVFFFLKRSKLLFTSPKSFISFEFMNIKQDFIAVVSTLDLLPCQFQLVKEEN